MIGAFSTTLLIAGVASVYGSVGHGDASGYLAVMSLAGWADPKETAAASAVFIWVNSAVGLAGHFAGGRAASLGDRSLDPGRGGRRHPRRLPWRRTASRTGS